MKRNLIVNLLACGTSLMLGVAAQAQNPTPPAPSTTGTSASSPCPAGHHRGGGMLEHLTKELNLTDEQKGQIAPIIEAAKPQMKAIHDDAQAKRKTLIDSVSAQITPLLTSDQQTKFTQMLQKFEAGPGPGARGFARHEGHGAPGGPGAAAPGNMLEMLTNKLGLTSDQQAQVKPILDAAHTQLQAIHADTTLTPEQKFAKVRETMEATHSQINGILTPAQQQQMAAMKQNFHRHGPEGQPSSSPAASPSATPASN